MNNTAEQCYMCDARATSSEHVPPRCIFPEAKDIPGEDYRKQLISVPSCDVHNSKKSKDDEFLLVTLAGVVGNNAVGYLNHVTKVQRAILYSSGRLLNTALTKRRHINITLSDGSAVPVTIGTPDFPRLHTCFGRMAFGLYRHHFGVPFRGSTKNVLSRLIHTENNPESFAEFVKAKADFELQNAPRFGSNPQVFTYQFTEPDEFKLRLLRMCFYEGIEVFTAMIPEGVVVPTNLAMQLINGGIKSYVHLGNKVFEFN